MLCLYKDLEQKSGNFDIINENTKRANSPKIIKQKPFMKTIDTNIYSNGTFGNNKSIESTQRLTKTYSVNDYKSLWRWVRKLVKIRQLNDVK